MAVVRSMSGEKLAEVRADYSGFLVSWSGGVAFQAGSSLGSCGLPDGLPMVVNCERRNGLSPRCRLTQTGAANRPVRLLGLQHLPLAGQTFLGQRGELQLRRHQRRCVLGARDHLALRALQNHVEHHVEPNWLVLPRHQLVTPIYLEFVVAR